MQIPHCVHPEISQEGVVRCSSPTTGRSAQAVGNAARKPDRRRATHARPCAYAGIDSAKYSVSQVVGYMKGKSAIHIARTFMGKPRNFTGESFWARGYFVSTVGRDEKEIREYIQKQEQEDQRIDQLTLFNK